MIVSALFYESGSHRAAEDSNKRVTESLTDWSFQEGDKRNDCKKIYRVGFAGNHKNME